MLDHPPTANVSAIIVAAGLLGVADVLVKRRLSWGRVRVSRFGAYLARRGPPMAELSRARPEQLGTAWRWRQLGAASAELGRTRRNPRSGRRHQRDCRMHFFALDWRLLPAAGA